MKTTKKPSTLGTFVIWAIAAGAAASIVGAPTAFADRTLPVAGAGSASDAIAELQADGFNVSINWLEGHPNVPLSECRVNAINNPNSSAASTSTFETVYVDVACPNAK